MSIKSLRITHRYLMKNFKEWLITESEIHLPEKDEFPVYPNNTLPCNIFREGDKHIVLVPQMVYRCPDCYDRLIAGSVVHFREKYGIETAPIKDEKIGNKYKNPKGYTPIVLKIV